MGKRTDAIRTVEDVRQRCYVDPDGCWHWRGGMRNAYRTPSAKIGGKPVSVRRWVVLQSRSLADDVKIVPKCGNSDCVAPGCARPKRPVEFAKWLMDEGHIHTPAHKLAHKEGTRKGPNVKLTPRMAAEIARLVRAGGDRGSIAAQFGITRSHVNNIARGDNWGEFTDPLAFAEAA
jgi:hypothetical protein